MTGRRNEGAGGPLPLAMTDAPNAKTALGSRTRCCSGWRSATSEAEGYAVIEAGNAAQALERLDGAVTLMVTDVRMPGAMDGLMLTHEVIRRRPTWPSSWCRRR